MANVSTLLLATIDCSDISKSFLFEVLRYTSSNGHRVLYIAPEQITALPPTVNNAEGVTEPEIMRLISFLYLPTKQDLLTYLSSIHKIHRPPTAIVVQDLHKYCTPEDVSLVCGMLYTAASISSERLTSKTTLVASYQVPVPTVMLTNFFQNVWCLHSTDKEVVLKDIKPAKGGPSEFRFSHTEDSSRLMLNQVFERLHNADS